MRGEKDSDGRKDPEVITSAGSNHLIALSPQLYPFFHQDFVLKSGGKSPPKELVAFCEKSKRKERYDGGGKLTWQAG